MKKIFIYLFILLFVFHPVVQAATYYVREDGTEAFGSTTGCSAAEDAMNVAALEAGTFSGGPHTVIICNEGSEFSSGLIHDELNLISNHAGAGSGQEITFQCETGETCGFSTTHKYTNANWEQYNDQSGYTIFYVNTGSSTADYYGARDSGATERNAYLRIGTCTDHTDYTQDREFCGVYGGGDFFMRIDGEPASEPGDVWVGVREHAIEINGADWIILKDLILEGPQGQAVGDDDPTNNAVLYIHGDSDNITIGEAGAGLEIRYGKNDCVDISGSTVSNVTLQHSKIHGCWGGVFIDSTSAGSNTQILYNEVYNFATVDGDESGDRHGITVWHGNDVLIKGNYVHDQGHTWSESQTGKMIDHAILTYGSQNIDIQYNYIEEVAKGCISMSTSNSYDMSNQTVMYNICRNINKFPVDAGEDVHSGIRADCSIFPSGNAENIRLFGNLVDGAYVSGGDADVLGMVITTNDTNCGTTDHWYVHNNIIVSDPDFDWDFKIAVGTIPNFDINNNSFDEDGSTSDTDQIYYSGGISINTLNGYGFAENNKDVDCALQESGGMYYGIDASGGCDGVGYNAGAVYDDALDMDSTWDPISIVTQQQPASWDIGPWIEGTFDQPAPGLQDITVNMH